MAQERAFTTEEINAAVMKHLSPQKPVKVGGLDGHGAVACGMRGEGKVTISGKAGDFLAAFLDGPQVALAGSAGDYAGSTMVSGQLLVEGAVGKGFCCHMVGGTARIKGRCGEGAGAMMSGGLLVLDGPVGERPGEGMTGGTLVLLRPDALPPVPPAAGVLLVPRGTSLPGKAFATVELSHEEVGQLEGALSGLGVEDAPRAAGELVRVVPAPSARASAPGTTALPSRGVEVGPDLTSNGPVRGGAQGGEASPEAKAKRTASERFESFAREVKGKGG